MVKFKSFLLLHFVSFTILAGITKAQTINSIAGGYNGDGLSATSVGLNAVSQAVNAAGDIFIAVPDRHVVMKLSKGVYSTVAGNGIYGFSGDGGLATAAQLRNPWNVAVDAAGNVFIADNYDNRIRKVAPSGIITTVAGNGKPGFAGDGGLAVSAQLRGPVGVVVDAQGNILVADYVNRRVRKITADGKIATIAGNGTSGNAGDGGPAKAAQLGFVSGITMNTAGELFIADNSNSKIRKMDVNGIMSSVAGNGAQGFSGDGGLATAAKFAAINGVTTDLSGNLYIADTYNNRVRKVDRNGIVTTIAGNGGIGFSGDGAQAKSAQLYRPTNVIVDGAGDILISTNLRVRKVIASTGIINTIAGNGSGGYAGDKGPVSKAQFYHPVGLTTDAVGDVYFADRENHRVRKITKAGIISTVAGSGKLGFSGDGGLATEARINFPTSVAVDAAGNIFFTDYGNLRIRKVDINGIITTIAGTGVKGFNGDGLAKNATIWGPDGITLDASGNIFFADQFNNRIRKISPLGNILTIAGNGTGGFSGDNGPAILGSLYWPSGVKVDNAGNVFIADRRNYRIRKVSTLGIITTFAGNGSQYASGDGKKATTAGLDAGSVAADKDGNVYIADTYNERLRKVNTAGIISTFAGRGRVYGDGGTAAAALIHTPTSITIDMAGNIFITDYDNHRIRKITMPAAIAAKSSDGLNKFSSPVVKLTIYPSPVTSILYIKTPIAGDITTVEVIDALGKVQLSQKVMVSQSVITVQVQKLPAGAYFVRITDRYNSIIVTQFIKQ